MSDSSDGPGREGAPWTGWVVWLAVAVAALLLAVPLARFATASSEWIAYPYPRAGSEGLILYESLLVKHGGDIYAPIMPQRFISGPYPPLYYWLAAALLADALPDFSSPERVTSLFVPGRTVSLIASIAAALLIVALVVLQGGHTGKDRRILLAGIAGGTLGGVLLLTLPQVTVWATRFRGDMLMIALTVGGLACVAAGARPGQAAEGRRSWPWLIAAATLFSLAFFTKQTALAGPAASALYLLVRDWRTGLKWCAVMGTLVLVPLVLLDVVTGHWFYLKMVDYHSLPLRRLTLTRLLEFYFWEDQWPLILAAVGYVGLSLYLAALAWRAHTLRSVPLLIPLFVIAAMITLPTGAVVGADHNHLLMAGLAICAGTGALVADLLRRLTAPAPAGALAWASGAAVLALIATYALVTSEPSSWFAPDLTMPSSAQQEQLRKIVQNVRDNPGTLIYADDPGIAALAGKTTDYDDPFTMTALAEQGRWDETYFRDSLRSGRFPLLVLSCDVNLPNSCRADTFTPGVLDAIRAGYTVLFRDVLFTYAPR